MCSLLAFLQHQKCNYKQLFKIPILFRSHTETVPMFISSTLTTHDNFLLHLHPKLFWWLFFSILPLLLNISFPTPLFHHTLSFSPVFAFLSVELVGGGWGGKNLSDKARFLENSSAMPEYYIMGKEMSKARNIHSVRILSHHICRHLVRLHQWMNDYKVKGKN